MHLIALVRRQDDPGVPPGVREHTAWFSTAFTGGCGPMHLISYPEQLSGYRSVLGQPSR
jgi:hypothetical protein